MQATQLTIKDNLNQLLSSSDNPQVVIDEIYNDTIKFLSLYNQLSPLHKQFIYELIGHYVNCYFGIKSERVIIAAHPGMGKTTCLRFFLRWVIRDLKSGGKIKRGLLICSNQIDELEEHLSWLQETLGDVQDCCGLYHTRKVGEGYPVASLGALSTFPIVFSTQALIRKRGADNHQGKHNAEAKLHEVCFHEDTGVRLLCWDELAIATKANHIDIHTLQNLEIELTSKTQMKGREAAPSVLSTFLSTVIRPLLFAIKSLKLQQGQSKTIGVPKVDEAAAVDLGNYLTSSRVCRTIGQDFIETARAIAFWPGSSAAIHYNHTGEGKGAIMDFIIEIPSELDSAIITDASAAINKLIKLDPSINIPLFMQQHGSTLKHHHQLEVMTMQEGSGRASFANRSNGRITSKWEKIIKDVLTKVESRISLDDEVLIVTFKSKDKYGGENIAQIKELILDLGFNVNRYRFTTYGRHRGTNEFSNAAAVLLFGVLHQNAGELTSLARAQTRDPLDDQIQNYTVQELVDSQVASDIQQALCRGRCRHVETINGLTECKPMLAFVSVAKREFNGVLNHLNTAFPGFSETPLDTPSREKKLTVTELAVREAKSCLKGAKAMNIEAVKSSQVRELVNRRLEEVGLQPLPSKHWHRVASQVNVRGWARQGHSFIRVE